MFRQLQNDKPFNLLQFQAQAALESLYAPRLVALAMI